MRKQKIKKKALPVVDLHAQQARLLRGFIGLDEVERLVVGRQALVCSTSLAAWDALRRRPVPRVLEATIVAVVFDKRNGLSLQVRGRAHQLRKVQWYGVGALHVR